MHHLLLGLDPTELGGARSRLRSTRRAAPPRARAPGHPGARLRPALHRRPCRRRHAGGPPEGPLGEEVNLIIDVGTNAEIVLGNRDRLLAASSPTGPAFEGAQISCGQRAAPGAIDGADRPRHARAALPGDRQRHLVRRPGLRRNPRHRRLWLRTSRPVAELHLADSDHRRHDRRRAHVSLTRGSSPTAAPSRTSSRTGSRC